MNKKYYSFLILIFLMLFLIYNIVLHKYKEYKIQEHLKIISELNINIKNNIHKTQDIIEYKSSKAYKNKLLKANQPLKNKSEIVIYITTEDKYNKYIKNNIAEKSIVINKDIPDEIYWMTIYQKWIWFLFKHDLR